MRVLRRLDMLSTRKPTGPPRQYVGAKRAIGQNSATGMGKSAETVHSVDVVRPVRSADRSVCEGHRRATTSETTDECITSSFLTLHAASGKIAVGVCTQEWDRVWVQSEWNERVMSSRAAVWCAASQRTNTAQTRWK